jgi:serine/threonine-protein kinase
MMQLVTSVVIAEDSALMRQALCRLLEDKGFEVVGAVDSLPDLMAKVEELDPDVVVTDIRMPPTGTDEGLRAAEEIHREHPKTAVLVLSQFVESGAALKLMTSNPRGLGYLLKDRVSDVNELVSTIKLLIRGESAVDPDIVTELLARKRASDPLEALTEREEEILALMAAGRSNSAISEALFLSPKTVETHVRSMFTKLGLQMTPDDHRRVLAVLTYLRER